MLHYLSDTLLPFLQTFPDGSLYINNLGLHHMGNYTCQDKYEDTVIQTHILRVQCKDYYSYQQGWHFDACRH